MRSPGSPPGRARSCRTAGDGGAWPSARPETAFASVELVERRSQIGLAEVGPQRLGEDELGVGRLPEEVVRQAALPARADKDVRVFHLGGVQELRELVLVAFAEPARGIHD